MNFTTSMILILVIIVIYIVMINIFSIMLRMTGVPSGISIFQGISLFTNCGYTTSESETIATNKSRRKIALACMIFGNFFSVIIVSLIVNIFGSFSIENAVQTYKVTLAALAVFVVIIVFFKLPPVKRIFEKKIENIVDKSIEKNSQENVTTIVENFVGNSIVEVHLHWIPEILYGKTIHESKLKSKYNINILSIKRNKRSIEINRNTLVQKNDVLLLYGTYQAVKEVFTIEAEKERKEAQKVNKSFNELELIDNYSSNAMVEVKINSVPVVLEGKTLVESDLRGRFAINVMFIKRDGEILEVTKDSVIKSGDMLMVFGPFQAIKNVFAY